MFANSHCDVWTLQQIFHPVGLIQTAGEEIECIVFRTKPNFDLMRIAGHTSSGGEVAIFLILERCQRRKFIASSFFHNGSRWRENTSARAGVGVGACPTYIRWCSVSAAGA